MTWFNAQERHPYSNPVNIMRFLFVQWIESSMGDLFPKLSDIYLYKWCLLRFYIWIFRNNTFHNPCKKHQSEGQLKALVGLPNCFSNTKTGQTQTQSKSSNLLDSKSLKRTCRKWCWIKRNLTLKKNYIRIGTNRKNSGRL